MTAGATEAGWSGPREARTGWRRRRRTSPATPKGRNGGVEAARRHSGGGSSSGARCSWGTMGDVVGARGRRSSAPTARWGGGARAAEVGGARGRRRRRAGGAVGAGDDSGATQIKKTIKCWGRGRKKGDIGVGAFCPGWSQVLSSIISLLWI